MAGRVALPLTLIAALLTAEAPAEAAEPVTVSVTLSDREVLVGDVVSLQIRSVATVNGSIRVELPPVKGLTELSRSSSEGTSISWDNVSGQKVTREQTLTVELQADLAGTLSIPPVVARVGASSARSQPVTLVVVGSAALAEAAPQAEAGQVAPPDPDEATLFARYRLSKGRAYLGEQVLLDLEIFATPNRNFSLEEVPEAPELDGFWKQVVFKPQKLTRTIETVGGRRYHVYRLWRMALFGLSAGDRTLPPARLSFSTGRGMFTTGERIRVRTKPVKITIEPLPTEGRPAGFQTTNIGQYQLRSSVDAQTVPAGKAILLKISLFGSGNIDNARLPELKEMDGFRVFPPTVKAEPQTSLNGVSGTKTAEILLMPTRGGRLEVPALSLPVFNPKTGAYVQLSAPAIPIMVQGDPVAAPAVQAAPPPAAKVQVQLRPLHVRADVLGFSPPPFVRPLFFAALAAPALLFLLMLLGELVWSKVRQQTPEHRRRAVARDAQTRLHNARTEAEAGRMALAYAAFVDALFAVGSERMQVVLQGLTTDEVCEKLAAHGAEDATVQQVRQELETADYLRFASGAATGVDAGTVLSRWSQILASVEALASKETA